MGWRSVLVLPLPKFQAHVVMLPVEVSVKVTAKGAGPLVGVALKAATGLATGGAVTVI